MANKMKVRRAELNMTQKDVAEIVGIKEPQYRAYENGFNVPNLIMSQVIARALQIDLNTLADWIYENKQKNETK